MKNKYKKSEITDKLYFDIANFCNENQYILEVDDNYYYILKSNEKLVDGEIVDNSEEYNKKQQKEAAEREISELKQQLSDSDYKIIKSYEDSLMGLHTEYDISELHKVRQTIRDRINELEKLL